MDEPKTLEEALQIIKNQDWEISILKNQITQSGISSRNPEDFAPVVNKKYYKKWRAVADSWNPHNGKPRPSEAAPKDVNCKYCWDTGLCSECLGEYGPSCPNLCRDGRCDCQK